MIKKLVCFHNRSDRWPSELLALTPEPKLFLGDLDAYIQTKADAKIAFVTPFGPYGTAFPNIDEKFAQQLIDHSDLVFFHDWELHDFHALFIDKYTLDKVWYIFPGMSRDQNLAARPNVITNPDWFWMARDPYMAEDLLRNKLTQLTGNSQPKPYAFDALLGRSRPHRDLIYQSINDSINREKFLYSYQQEMSWEEFETQGLAVGADLDLTAICKAQNIEPHPGYWLPIGGITVMYAAIISTEVYNQTAYSIVAETEWHNTMVLFTEKLVRPMLARRLFVLFGPVGYLELLQQLGFRTFSDIIDESYDKEVDYETRWRMAWEQVEWLCEQDQSIIFSAIEEVVEHNFQLLMTTDWQSHYVGQVQSLINRVLEEQA